MNSIDIIRKSNDFCFPTSELDQSGCRHYMISGKVEFRSTKQIRRVGLGSYHASYSDGTSRITVRPGDTIMWKRTKDNANSTHGIALIDLTLDPTRSPAGGRRNMRFIEFENVCTIVAVHDADDGKVNVTLAYNDGGAPRVLQTQT